LSQADAAKIEVLGKRATDHVRKYDPAHNIEQVLKWM